MPDRSHTPTSHPLAAVVALGAVLAAAGCGPSPVEMTDQPVTSTTPSRSAGQQLAGSPAPEEACATAPIPPETGDAGTRAVGAVQVPRAPQRILALGVTGVDTACALGLQGLLVGTGGLPEDADAYLPGSLVSLPDLDLDAPDLAERARELRPDVILTGRGRDADALAAVAPVVTYDPAPLEWSAASRTVADALGRPKAGEGILLDVLGRAREVGAKTGARDTRVSLLDVDTGDSPSVSGPALTVAPAETLGSQVLEAVGAARPPAQRTENGRRVPPLPESPAAGDPRSGDVVFVVVGRDDAQQEAARHELDSAEWRGTGPAKARRVFVVDRAVWAGAGPVAARAAIADVEKSINGVAPDG